VTELLARESVTLGEPPPPELPPPPAELPPPPHAVAKANVRYDAARMSDFITRRFYP